MTVTRLTQKEDIIDYKPEDRKLKPPIFIVGCGRSGTTLLLNCLGRHKNIYAIKKETQLFVSYKTKSFLYFDKCEKEKDFEKLTLSILTQIFYGEDYTSKVLWKNQFPREIIKLFEEIKTEDGFKKLKNKYEIFDVCVKYLTSGEKKLRWVEKTPNNIFTTKLLLERYSKAKFVEIYRDPRAVWFSWLSAKFEYFKTSYLLECIMVWRRTINQGLGLVNEIPKQYFQVRYEDLINNPTEEITKICNFINEDFDPHMLNVEVVSNFFDDHKDFKGFSKTPLERWEKMLSTNELMFIDFLTKRQRKRLGYPDSNAKLMLVNLVPFFFFVLKKCIEARKQIKLFIKCRLRGFLNRLQKLKK